MKLSLEKYFDSRTMSVHLREGVVPVAKKGKPGEWQFEELSQEKLTTEEIEELSGEITEEAKSRKDSFIEAETAGTTIIQLGPYRIVITEPPFSDGWEITAVKAVKQLNFEEYELTEKLRQRLTQEGAGILIAGRPGEGKSTFARALAEFYAASEKIVKTVESPRDMLLSDKITQYSVSLGTPEQIRNVLLLTRPDNSIFDEMRNTSDFLLYADLRLAGIGMVGVVHATDPIDAIQRFIGRLELGVIPHVIDTVVFIKHGRVGTVLALELTVKVPSGMQEADLARPIVTVSDFETGKLEYEIYSYGEQTVVVPVDTRKEKSKASWRLAEEQVKLKFKKYCQDCEVEMVSEDKAKISVPENEIARLIGSGGKNIEKIEREIGVSIDLEEMKQTEGVSFEGEVANHNLVIYLHKKMANKELGVYAGDDFLMTVFSGKKAMVRIGLEGALGKNAQRAWEAGELRLEAVKR